MAEEIEAVALLADPVRRSLYDFVVAQDHAVSREQAADGAGVPVHSARFHLDRLVGNDLLEVEYRRLTGRTGPGAGRPAKLYRRAHREVSVSLPQRNYDLVGSVMAAAIERSLNGEAIAVALGEEARSRGQQLGESFDGAGDDLERTSGALGTQGFEPYDDHDSVCLRNCPFDSLARAHPTLVCGVNLDFVSGVVEGLGCKHADAQLDPEPDRCCVRISRH